MINCFVMLVTEISKKYFVKFMKFSLKGARVLGDQLTFFS